MGYVIVNQEHRPRGGGRGNVLKAKNDEDCIRYFETTIFGHEDE